jgi:iron complex outermembrane receptor protein
VVNVLKFSLLASVTIAGGMLMAAPAWSQDITRVGKENTAIQEIIVTAQRRAENQQNVPIAITAISGVALSAGGIDATTGLISVTPGLNYTVAAGVYAQPKIRGIGTSSNGPGIENPVATYIDGVYISSMSGSLLNLSDVEQVAVLKGPQGTLFGRNATGGLIQITTRRPEQQRAMNFSIGYGNLDTVTASAFVNTGLGEGLAANASIYYQNRGNGFGKNLFNGLDVYKSRNFAARSKVRWEPGPSTTLTLSGDYSKIEGPINGLRNVAGSFNVLGLLPAGGRYDVTANVQPAARLEQYGTSLTATQSIGGLELQSITAFRKTVNRTNLDYDKTVLPLTNVLIRQFDKQFSQEFQIQPQGHGPFQWILGAYYFWAKAGYDGTTTNGLNIPNGVSLVQNSDQTVQSLSGYAQATYALGSDTNVTAGLRYTTDLRELHGRIDAILPNGVIANTTLSSGRLRFSKLTWRLAVDHRFSPELLAYASYNRGFKSGAFLLQSFPAANVKPETLDAFEVGIKSDLLDRRVRLNMAAFYYDYTNIQIQLINRGLLSSYSGSGAKLYGLDGDLTAKVTSDFTINVGASYLHNEYKAFQAFSATPIVPQFPPPVGRPNGGNAIGTVNAVGNKLQAAPDWTLNVGANYKIDLGNDRVELNANYYHNDGWFAEPDNRLKQQPYDTLNASISYTINDNLTFSIFGKNLTDEYYAAFLGEQDVGDTITAAEGRTYGIKMSAHF